MLTTRLSRELVYARRGIVCSNSPLAVSAGVRVMQEGGNAFDAALAVAAAEAVTLVPFCGMGGDSFILLYQVSSGRVTEINSSGATADYYRSMGHRTLPIDGPHSISVPGEVAAWEEVHRRFCTKPFSNLLDTAVGYAEEGFPILPGIGRSFAHNVAKLAQFPSSQAIYLASGKPRQKGDILVNRDLARSLLRVAEGGAEEFYRGRLAREMVKGLGAAGGLFTEEGLAGHHAEVHDPTTTTYRGHSVYQTSPPSQGFLLLEMLNLVEGFDLGSLGHNSPEAIHLIVEAKKIAYDDRNRLAGDPKVVDWPLKQLVSKDYASRRRREINLDRAGAAIPSLQPVDANGNTTYFCVADGEGNCVSWIHSLSNAFGSGFVAEGTGVRFNNRAGRGFSLVPGHPNIIAPGKRTMHTLNCYRALKDGSPVIIGGTPGGDFQV